MAKMKERYLNNIEYTDEELDDMYNRYIQEQEVYDDKSRHNERVWGNT